MTKSFSADIKNWNDKARRNMQGIMREFVQEIVEEAQNPVAQGGNMPVDEATLRNSLASGVDGSFGQPAADSYIITVAEMEIGDIANFAWTAAHARPRHYKPESFGQGGGMWRDKAIQKAPSILDRVAKRFS